MTTKTHTVMLAATFASNTHTQEAHLVIDETISHLADSRCIHCVYTSKQLCLGDAPAIHQQLPANRLRYICAGQAG